jgi:hypothetical protein
MATQIIKPDLPSTIIRWIGQAATRILPTLNQVVAVPIVHDWGPMLGDTANAVTGAPGGVEVYTSLAQWEAVYGTGDTPGRDAVVGAFLGMGVPGGGGAGGVITPRMGTVAAAAATITRQNTTPANALTLTAKYKGVRGNLLSIVIEADPQTAANDRLRLLFNGVTVESYSYVRTDIASLAAAINATSRWVVASGVISGVALATTTGVTLAGGNDGSTLTTVEWQAAQDALAFKDFGVFAPYNLTDVPTKVQLATWLQSLADGMRPVRAVFGGAAGEDPAVAAVTELTSNPSLRNEQIVRLGGGTWHDDLLNKDFSTAQLAPRIAGIVAARGLKAALTGAKLGGLHVVGNTGPSDASVLAAKRGGVTCLRRVSAPDAELAVAWGVTTFISTTTAGKPYEFFSEPRIVGVLNDFQRRMTSWGNDIVIGDLMVTDDTRREVSKQGRKILDEYEAEGIAQPGTGFIVVPTETDPSLADTITFQFGFKPSRTANFLVGEGRIS